MTEISVMALAMLPAFVQPLLLSHALSGVDSKQHCNVPNEGVQIFEPRSGEVLRKPVDFKTFHSLQFVEIQHRPHLTLAICSVNNFA